MCNLRLKGAIVMKYGSQATFASAIGVFEPIVSRVITGRHTLSADDREKWAKLLGVEANDLFVEPEKVIA